MIVKPVDNGYITSYFDEIRGTKIHGGYDIGCKQHPAYVKAICDSIVYTLGWSDTFGNRIWVVPKDKSIRTKYPYIVYAHLEKFIIKNRREVNAGDIIGIMGNTGLSHGVHLHIEARTKPDITGKPIEIVELKELYETKR